MGDAEIVSELIDILREMTGKSPEAVLTAVKSEGERYRREGLIEDHVTPFGTITVMKHPLLHRRIKQA